MGILIGGPKDEGIRIQPDRAEPGELPYHCVSTAKLVILSLVTLGIYELVWFYANWVRVRQSTGRNISPFWRAAFAPLYCYSLGAAVKSTAESLHVRPGFQPWFLALAYVGLIALERLPDPWWLLATASVVPLIAIQRVIVEIHGTLRPGTDTSVGWNRASVASLAIGGVFTAFLMWTMFGPLGHAMRESEIPQAYRERLVELGVVEPDERVRYFYSAGFFGIDTEGNVLTDRGVSTYEELDGQLYVARASYAEIAEIEVTWSTSEMEDTVIDVVTHEGVEFVLIVGPERQRDREFVAMLRAEVDLRL